VKRASYVALRDWCGSTGLNGPVPASESAQSVLITNTSGALLLRTDSLAARWNGIEVHLGFAPMLVQGQVYVRAADIKSTLCPLLLPNPPILHRAKVIVLDPGHGGADSGARSISGGNEKDYTLDWALRLRSLLQSDGWEVFLTRSTDMEVPLTNRVTLAESVQADLFLSLHFNSSAPDKAGLETYCLTPAGVPSTLTRGYADELDLTLPNNSHDARNLQLSVLLHRSLLEVAGKRDRGIRRARFPAVLRTQNRPAVLIEGGYLSNMMESRLISSPVYRHKLAAAIAEALRPFAPGAPDQTTNSLPATATQPNGS
jgi:N-acetylmuramoyl-L-alanine amidase